MFTIIGGDGKEYGPATVEQLRAWIAGGRASLDTKAKALGSEEWRRLGDYAEFAGPVDTPPVIGSVPPGTAGPGAAGGAAATAELAGRGVRLGAAIIDRVIASAAIMPGLVILGPSFLKMVLEASRGDRPDFSTVNLASFGLGALVLMAGWFTVFAIQLWLLTTRGQTIGKRVLGIKIVLHRDGGPPGFVHAWLLRNLVPNFIAMIPWLGMVFVLVDVCFIFGEPRRCIHDYIAGTKVVVA